MPAKVVKKKRRKKSKVYFGTPVQNAIIRYNECSNPTIRNRIYREHIAAAFDKLAENLIQHFLEKALVYSLRYSFPFVCQ